MDKNIDFQNEMLALSNQLETDENMPDQLMAEAEAEAEEQKKAEDKSLLDVIIEEGYTTQEQIDIWKGMYSNKVFAVYFDKDDVFIYRYVTRTEWKEIWNNVSKSTLANKDELLDEMLVTKCVLYPKLTPEFKVVMPGGSMETLGKQIRISSNFIPDDIAVRMITKL